jgi:hypothetical protein
MTKTSFVVTIVAGLVVTAVTGQSAGAQAAAPPPGTYGVRAENQQDRIGQGVKSGSLTAGETARLETREAHINQQVRADRAGDNGHMTAGERAKVNREQNRTSGAIYRDKHNGKTQPK